MGVDADHMSYVGLSQATLRPSLREPRVLTDVHAGVRRELKWRAAVDL